MKKLSFCLVFFLFSISIFAQTFLDVTPGYGTLNDAITANKGNVIYRLQAGQWYSLNGQIENNGFMLTIVGTTPLAGQMPAVIQAATLPDGTVLSDMFNILNDFTIRNVFIINANANDAIGTEIFGVNSPTPNRIVFDNITCDPVGTWGLINFGATPHPKLFITNSLFLRHGQLNSNLDGWMCRLAGAPDNGYDTLYIENNTFLSTGTWLLIGADANADSENFVWINHNSFIFHKNQYASSFSHMNSNFVTNNLFFDFESQPGLVAWNIYSPDGDTTGPESLFPLVPQDTTWSDTKNGQLLSQRKFFVEYNSFYTDPRIVAYTTSWAATHTVNNDGVTPIPKSYIQHLMYPSDSAGVNREAHMSNDKTHFPYFYEGNYLDNYIGTNPPNTDPQWTDSKFYAIQDSLVNWTLPAAELGAWGFSANNVNPQPNQAGNWYWNADPVYNYGNPVVWPRVDCSYKNNTMLSASIEGLPLGDLNWFPTAKAAWLSKQTEIMNYILAENVSQMNIGNAPDTAVASSIAAPWITPMAVLDNNLTSFWASQEHVNAPNTEEWIYIDQRIDKNVAEVQLIPREDSDNIIYCFPQDFTIQYSDDAVNWTVVPGQSYTNYPLPQNQNPLIFTFSSTINCRYVRIDATKLRVDAIGGDNFSLAEFRLFSTATGVNDKGNEVVKEYNLSQNYPNPFNPTTTINYSIKKQGLVTLKVYNMLGQEVVTLVNKEQNEGNYSISFNADKLTSGVYIYRITAGNFSASNKLMLLK